MTGESFSSAFARLVRRLRGLVRRQDDPASERVNIGCLTIRLQMLNDGTMTKEQFRELVTPRNKQDGRRPVQTSKTKGRE